MLKIPSYSVMDQYMITNFKELILGNKGAVEAFQTLGNGASIRVIMCDGCDILVSKASGKINVNRFNPSSDRPDLTVSIPYETVQSVFSAGTSNARDFIVNSASILTDKDNIEKISVSAHTGIMKLTMLGYLKAIPIGGSGLIKILSRYGINSITDIKRKLAKLTNR